MSRGPRLVPGRESNHGHSRPLTMRSGRALCPGRAPGRAPGAGVTAAVAANVALDLAKASTTKITNCGRTRSPTRWSDRRRPRWRHHPIELPGRAATDDDFRRYPTETDVTRENCDWNFAHAHGHDTTACCRVGR